MVINNIKNMNIDRSIDRSIDITPDVSYVTISRNFIHLSNFITIPVLIFLLVRKSIRNQRTKNDLQGSRDK